MSVCPPVAGIASIAMKNKTYEKIINKGLKSARYKYPEPARRDLLAALTSYKGLQPKVDNFVFDSGNEETLVGLQGTIPIVYRSNTYNIPVCFWLQTDHPSVAPIGFVQPTHDMQIKPSQAVDYSGKITLPYLDEWKYPESSLNDFMQICTLVFGQSPPVFSKKSSSSSSSHAARNPSSSGSEVAAAAANIVRLPPSVKSSDPENAVTSSVESEVTQQTEVVGARSVYYTALNFVLLALTYFFFCQERPLFAQMSTIYCIHSVRGSAP